MSILDKLAKLAEFKAPKTEASPDDLHLPKAFAKFQEASAKDKAMLSSHFENGKPGKHEAHSPLLGEKTASLTERVVSLLGRR